MHGAHRYQTGQVARQEARASSQPHVQHSPAVPAVQNLDVVGPMDYYARFTFKVCYILFLASRDAGQAAGCSAWLAPVRVRAALLHGEGCTALCAALVHRSPAIM